MHANLHGRSERSGRIELACAIALLFGLAFGLQSPGVQAATCKDQLDRFERRLHDSDIAATEPDRYSELLRRARAAAELRDRVRCLQRVAELNQELPPEQRGGPISRGGTNPERQQNAARPSAPVLLATDNDGDADADDPSDEDGVEPRQ